MKLTLPAVLIAALMAAATPFSVRAQTSLILRADTPGPMINRDIFGQFAEQLGEGVYGGIWVGKNSKIPNVRGIRTDVVQALRAIKVPNVRWPGGCFADEYHWRDGIGPAAARVSHINQWGHVLEPNDFGTDEYMDFIQQIGSDAYISVNVGSATPQEAADWLEYMTSDLPTTLGKARVANGHKAPYRVKYLGLGNESWGCGGGMTAEAYATQMKIFATFTRNHHPDQRASFIKPAKEPMMRVAVGQGLGETAYTDAVMKAWQGQPNYAGNIDMLSLHYYSHAGPFPMSDASTGFGEKDYANMLKNTLNMNTMITEHSAIMDRYDPQKKVGLAIDEWGAWLRPMGSNFLFLRQQNSMRDAIVAALNLNIFARHADRVRMSNIAQMVNVIQSMILTDKDKMLLTPTYHVYKLYLPFQGAQLIPVTFEPGTYKFGDISLPQIDGIAAKAKDGSIWLAMTNIDPNQGVDVSAVVQGLSAKAADGAVLTAPKVDSINTFEAPNAVSTKAVRFAAESGKLVLHLPPKSVTVVQIEQ